VKIAIMVGGFLPKWLGGTEIATYNLARHLARRGHEVHVITSRDKGQPSETVVEGFRLHRLSIMRIRYLGAVLFWIKPLGLLKRIDPDVILVQSMILGMGGYLAKLLLKKPYVVWGQGDEYLRWLFKGTISKIVLKHAAAALASTQDMATTLKRTYQRDITVVPNGIDIEQFSEAATLRKSARNKLGIQDTDMVLVFVGRLLTSKGLVYLLKSMPIVLQHANNIKLVMVGDGADRSLLEQMALELGLQNNIIFTGMVPNEAVPGYLAAADIFVFPSLSEGFGIVVVEAMASGLPLVSTNVHGLPEIIENGQNGLLVEPRSPEQIAEKVLLLVESDDLRKTMAENNKAGARRYSWENVVGMVEEVLKSAVNR
jgi:glycosyltransferase involved in cell wall biosynthesis